VARILVGLPATGKLPAVGTRQRTDYQSAMRGLQRATTTAGQTRPGNKKLLPGLGRVREVLQQRATAARLDALARRGARVRIFATVLVPSPSVRGTGVDSRRRELPAGGPGQLLKGDAVRAWARPLLAGTGQDADADAGREFAAAFADAYGIPDSTEFEDIERLTVWADDEPEPRQ